MTLDDRTPPTGVCAATEWKHVCHLPQGHHGPHQCTTDPHDCDFTWPNENELRPCPSTNVAILGALEPNGARLRCGLLEGHDGRHRFVMEWADA